MISVIVATVDPARMAAVKAAYSVAMGDYPWELIAINDARSLAEACNRGVAGSKGDYLIFSHDGVDFLTADLPRRLVEHFRQFDLLGVAGARRVCGGNWTWAGPPYLYGQFAQMGKDSKMKINLFSAPRATVGTIQALDGLFMAARRSIFEQASFDASRFDGFHLHDLDFSFQAHLAGLRVGVACDLNLLDRSPADYGPAPAVHIGRFEQKWREKLFPTKPLLFKCMTATVRSTQEALQVMNPPYWRQ